MIQLHDHRTRLFGALYIVVLCVLFTALFCGCGQKETTSEQAQTGAASAGTGEEAEAASSGAEEDAEAVSSDAAEESVSETSGSDEETASAGEEKTDGATSVSVEEGTSSSAESAPATEEENMETLKAWINETEVEVVWEDNEAVRALRERAMEAPVRVAMHLYGGFEQVGDLGFSLPTEDEQKVTEAGDLVLYQGNQLVAFYGSNTWSYTHLGKVTNKTKEEMMLLLGGTDVMITIADASVPVQRSYELKDVHPVKGRQGICVEGDHYWVSGSTSLTKYDKDWNVVAENTDPFVGFDLEVNHIGDIDVYQNELYLGVEYFMDGVGSNIQVAVYDGDTLECKRVFPFREDTGQLECSGVAVDAESGTVYLSSWIDDASSKYLYMYDLKTGEYRGKLEMDPVPKWSQGVACYKGDLYVTCDDGDADLDEPDNLYKLTVDEAQQKASVTRERAFTDVIRQGEIEGLSFDSENKQFLLLYNRGARIVQGMPSGFYEGYTEEIHEVFIYDI